jgi:hypothetical protein
MYCTVRFSRRKRGKSCNWKKNLQRLGKGWFAFLPFRAMRDGVSFFYQAFRPSVRPSITVPPLPRFEFAPPARDHDRSTPPPAPASSGQRNQASKPPSIQALHTSLANPLPPFLRPRCAAQRVPAGSERRLLLSGQQTHHDPHHAQPDARNALSAPSRTPSVQSARACSVGDVDMRLEGKKA